MSRISLTPYLPPVALLLFAAWAGTFPGGATFAGAVAVHLALPGLALVAAFSPDARLLDPLRMGSAGRLLPAALAVAVIASMAASPVPRAGRVAVILLPAFLLLPAAVAHCWRSEEDRRRGLAGIAVVTAVVAAWSLLDRFLGGSPRAAMPLGHHSLLATWLVLTLPLAVVPLRRPGIGRLLAVVAVASGIAAVVASGSFLGLAALGLQGAGAAVLLRRSRRLGRWRWVVLGGLAVVALVAAWPRALAIVEGKDPSALARATYARAGWEGFSARPLLGWGPGATPWTVGSFLEARPGINPPGEVVGHLHSLPVQLAYELGVTGLLISLAVALLFVLRRLRELPESADPALLGAALLALAGGGVTLLGTAALEVTALPFALAVAAGAALAASSHPGWPRSLRRPPTPAVGNRWVAYAGGGYALLALILLAPLDLAHLHYQRAIASPPEEAYREIAAATRLDPGFPLYRVRWTWSQREIGGADLLHRQSAAALEAARDAPGVGALWLTAGVSGIETGEPWARPALARACRLDPLSPLAPFFLAVSAGSAEAAAGHGARALAAEPRLAAALFWEERNGWLERAVAEVERWPGIDAGWRASFVAEMAALPPPAARRGPVTYLSWAMDLSGAESLSLHLFRRSPWPIRLAPVAVREEVAREITLPPAATLPETTPRAFAEAGCRLKES